MGGDLDIDHHPALRPVFPQPRFADAGSQLNHGIEQKGDFLFEPDVLDGHGQELFAYIRNG